MSDTEDKPLAPVFHGDKDVTNARQLAGRVTDPLGFEKQYRTAPDGAITRLDTKGGRPQVVVENPVQLQKTEIPCGLVAYPVDAKNSTSWSKPCVLKWSNAKGSWDVNFYNPPQTKKHISELPRKTDLKVTYWTNEKGGTSVACGNEVFWTKKSRRNKYSEWKTAKVAGEHQALVPFYSAGRYLFIQPQEATKLVKPDGTVVFSHYAERDYGGDTGVKPYDEQLPMAVTSDGKEVLMQSASAVKWGVPGPGFYDAVREKAYWVTRLVMPSLAVMQAITLLPNYGVIDVPVGGDAGSDEDVAGASSITGSYGYIKGPGSQVGYFSCRPTDAEGYLTGDVYNTAYYIPPTIDLSMGDNPWPDPIYSSRQHAWHSASFVKDISETRHIGNLANGRTVAPVEVRMVMNLNYVHRGEGKKYVGGFGGAPYMGIGSPASPDLGIYFYRGATSEAANERTLANSGVDRVSITVSVAGLSVEAFSHEGLCNGQARARDGLRRSQIISAHERGWIFDGVEGTLDKARMIKQSDIPACTVGVHPYPGDTGPASTAQSAPTVSAFFDAYNPEYDGSDKAITEFSPYAGQASFVGYSRTVLGADVALDFIAYVEAKVASTCNYSSAPGSWLVGRANPALTTVHTISYKVVIKYKGVTYSQSLFDYSCTKPGPWALHEIEDWLTWPWAGIVPGVIYFVGPPRITADAGKFNNIDNVFQHQGVNSAFAGIPSSEIKNDDPDGCIVFSKRFRLKKGSVAGDGCVSADWLLDDYSVTEAKRGATIDSPPAEQAKYHYCPTLKTKIEDDWYQIEFDQNGLRAWLNDVPARKGLVVAAKDDREAICYRV